MFRLLKRRTGDSFAPRGSDNESVETLACRFEGTTKGYFEIWIVNLLMMVCTLGIFYPWAKARRRQYFYSHTWLGRNKADYFAEPKKSLPSALLVSLLMLAAVTALAYEPVFVLPIVALMVLLYPWASHHELKCSAAATSYRARRLSYSGSLKDSYLRLIGWPIATVALAFLPLGHSMRSSWSYRYENYNYGPAPFAANFKAVQFWGLVINTALCALLVAMLVLAVSGGILFYNGGLTAVEYYSYAAIEGQLKPLHGLVGFIMLLAMVFPAALWSAKSERLLLAGVRLQAGIALDSEMSLAKMTGIYFFNALAIILTLGFAIPWAAIRIASYRASVTTMVCYTDLDELAGDRAAGLESLQKASGVVGEDERVNELSEALDKGELDLPRAA